MEVEVLPDTIRYCSAFTSFIKIFAERLRLVIFLFLWIFYVTFFTSNLLRDCRCKLALS